MVLGKRIPQGQFELGQRTVPHAQDQGGKRLGIACASISYVPQAARTTEISTTPTSP